MSTDFLDITPDPKVLIALTHTPIKPLDALCELIDNGLDAFRAAQLQGTPIRRPLVQIQVPGEAEARRGESLLRVTDNGPGLDAEQLTNAIRAGYSGKNKFDSLGLFGMGFNIATGKLGRRTVVTTARRVDDFALRVVIDLPTLVKNRRFEVPVERVSKPLNFESGTIIEVSDWWPDGDPNSGFILQLARIPKKDLRAQIGRRYATLLRRTEENSARVLVNNENVEPFEHCVWSESRFVERVGWGMIHARVELNSVLQTQRRCLADGAVQVGDDLVCLECGGTEFRSVEERVHGWIGIQRFDDSDRFGIDLIRNGRAIRVAEKDAFFTFADGLESIKEYPVDQQYGRIVGEVHLDHVPVDFQKQDFQRSSEEWDRAIKFLRGGSLLPSKWPDGERNESPVSKLFQGYRKVRNFGKQDLYMGRYDESTGKAVRVSRDVEREFYARFVAQEEGYYDDAKWWDAVEGATVSPVMPFQECPSCGFQNRPSDDCCEDCGFILSGKPCVECGLELRASATQCGSCGASQVPEVLEPWRCDVCRGTNGVDDDHCGTCGQIRGAESPIAPEVLARVGTYDPLLSFESRTFLLADGAHSDPVSLKSFRVPSGALRPIWDKPPVATISRRSAGVITVYLDPTHAAFALAGALVETALAVEVGQYLHTLRADLAGRDSHSVQNIATSVLLDVWGDRVSLGPERLRDAVVQLFATVAERLEGHAVAKDFFAELTPAEQTELANRLITMGEFDRIEEYRESGRFLSFAPPTALTRLFSHDPETWFGLVWSDELPSVASVPAPVLEAARGYVIRSFGRSLEECGDFAAHPSHDPMVLRRVRSALTFLEGHLQ